MCKAPLGPGGQSHRASRVVVSQKNVGFENDETCAVYSIRYLRHVIVRARQFVRLTRTLHINVLKGSSVYPVVVAKCTDYQNITRITRLVYNINNIVIMCVSEVSGCFGNNGTWCGLQ